MPRSYSKPPIIPDVRLRAVLAREAPIGLVLRRGPKDWTQATLWHTDTDEFERGQWFHGTIRSASISPDGKIWAYWAVQYHLELLAKPERLPTLHSRWASLAKPPYFSALATWDLVESQSGTICFPDSKQLLLSDNGDKAKQRSPSAGSLPPGLTVVTEDEEALEARCEAADGWQQVGEKNTTRILRKASSASGDVMLEQARGYKLVIKDGDRERKFALQGARWADFDQAGRLVFTREGLLFAGKVENGEVLERELANFTKDKPEDKLAPPWARKW